MVFFLWTHSHQSIHRSTLAVFFLLNLLLLTLLPSVRDTYYLVLRVSVAKGGDEQTAATTAAKKKKIYIYRYRYSISIRKSNEHYSSIHNKRLLCHGIMFSPSQHFLSRTSFTVVVPFILQDGVFKASTTLSRGTEELSGSLLIDVELRSTISQARNRTYSRGIRVKRNTVV